MRDAPLTAELIAIARETLKSEILPGLSGDAAYAGAMIANALGIALRDLDGDSAAAEEAERTALRNLLGQDRTDLTELNTGFAAAIRAGRFDPAAEDHDAARRLLWSQTVERLARVNPKRLDADRAAGRVPDQGRE